MNRILFGLSGVCVAAVFAFAFIAKVDVAKIGVSDVVISIAFVVLTAAGSFALHFSPWGRRLKSWSDKNDDKVRIAARDKGTVRRPPWWFLWP